METMERKKPRPRRSFTPEFKADIVERCRAGDRSIGQVAKDFELTETAVRAWVQAGRDRRRRTRRPHHRGAPGADPAAPGEPPAARGRGDPEAGHSFLREGDPVKVHPFIEAEKSRRHSVPRRASLLEVSRAAYYERRNGDAVGPGGLRRRAHRDRSQAIHTESKGTYGSPRVHQALPSRASSAASAGGRLMRIAGLEGRCKKRWRKTTIADPAAEAALDLIRRTSAPGPRSTAATSGDITYIATWEGWAYLATVIDLSCRKVVGWALADHMRTELVADAFKMAFTTAARHEGSSSTRTVAVNTRVGTTASSPGSTASCCRSGSKGECWDNAVAESFFATIKRELIDTRAWPTGEACAAPSSTTSRAGTTSAGCTAHSATAVRPSGKLHHNPTVRRHNQHKQPVRQTGSSPGDMGADQP